MTTLREAAQQALEALCRCTPEQRTASDALRAALAQEEQEPGPEPSVAQLNAILDGLGVVAHGRQSAQEFLRVWIRDWTAHKIALAQQKQKQEPVAWTDRELELIDGMIEVQLRHAAQCDAIANRPMAERQKGWDMERVALLRKIKSISPRREMVAATRAAIAKAEGEET